MDQRRGADYHLGRFPEPAPRPTPRAKVPVIVSSRPYPSCGIHAMTAPGAHPFTGDHYRTILTSALDSGYRFALFNEAVSGPTVYLRHDVDNSVADALDMARLEAALSVRSSYLFLLRSANYNPFTADNVMRIREIARLGHAIGLHFSDEDEDRESFYTLLPKRISKDARLLGEGVDLPITLFSFHNPAGKDEFQVEVPGLINTYRAKFFNEIKYLSESNFRWREGCPCILFRERRYPALQLLVHPMTYAADLHDDREALQHFLYIKLLELKSVNEAQNGTLRTSPLDLRHLLDDFLRDFAKRKDTDRP